MIKKGYAGSEFKSYCISGDTGDKVQQRTKIYHQIENITKEFKYFEKEDGTLDSTDLYFLHDMSVRLKAPYINAITHKTNDQQFIICPPNSGEKFYIVGYEYDQLHKIIKNIDKCDIITLGWHNRYSYVQKAQIDPEDNDLSTTADMDIEELYDHKDYNILKKISKRLNGNDDHIDIISAEISKLYRELLTNPIRNFIIAEISSYTNIRRVKKISLSRLLRNLERKNMLDKYDIFDEESGYRVHYHKDYN